MRGAAGVAVAAALLLAGCGADAPADSGAPAESGAATALTITVVPFEDADPFAMELTCDPPGGDHPYAEAACGRIAEAAMEIFDPTPDDQACTMIFGGPQTATISGTYDGDDVDASFSRENGCEIDRWDALGTEVFDVPLQ